MFESLRKSVFLKDLVLIHTGDLPFAKINEAIAVKISSRESPIDFFLQIYIPQVLIDFAETIKKFIFRDHTI